MKSTQHLLDRLAQLLMVIGAACILMMMLQVVAEATLRTLFKQTIPGTEEIVSAYYMIGCAFLPLAWVQRHKGHVIIEIFTIWMSPRAAAALDGVVAVAVSVCLTIYAYAGLVKAVAMTRDDEILIGMIDVVVWPSRWMVPAGLILMVAFLLLQAVDELRYAIKGGQRSITPAATQH